MSFTFHTRPNTTDDRIVREVYTDNHYRVSSSLKGKAVIDIGANIGAFSILCAERGADVFAFEPEPNNFQLLLRHIKEAGLENKITPMQMGVGGEGIHKLYVNPNNYGANSQFIKNNLGLREDNFVYMYMTNDFGTGDIVKIDCEGGEIGVLKSIVELPHRLPEKMIVEFHESSENKRIQEALARIYNVETISDHEFIYNRRSS